MTPSHASDPLILVIDLGTTACKVGLVTPNGRVVAYMNEADATPTHFGPGGKAEQSTDDWWAVITRNVRRVFAESSIAKERIVGVGVSTHWSGTVAVDGNGQALGNAIIWMDSRGAPYVEAVTHGFPKVEGYGARKLTSGRRRGSKTSCTSRRSRPRYRLSAVDPRLSPPR
jgi:xylulokinase